MSSSQVTQNLLVLVQPPTAVAPYKGPLGDCGCHEGYAAGGARPAVE